MFNEGGIENPMNDFNYHVPLERASDEKFIWLTKNLQANFYKIFSCAINLVQLQSDYAEEDKSKTLNTQTFSVNSVEYFFIKVNTIFELCYQIYDFLDDNTGKKKKFDRLDDGFKRYAEKTKVDLNYAWYKEINEVRNRIIHGGCSIKTFNENGRFLFQAYDLNLNERICTDGGYFKKDSNLIYIDHYMVFFVSVIHWYIKEFLSFVLYELCVDVDDGKLEPFHKMMKDSGSSRVWSISQFEIIRDFLDENCA
ncbi:hypothetical protein [Thalassolituus oleivorans]|uniref:hypothetical protein n=1 Tax=Thalassolituus oleivorans TaxID=187493 RepID=UPI00042DD62F|nr:hypothetical protein [Thalassolituus oleivorans]AHK17502.1 hypothetical protein R615_07345 [Thalassolituus oleivorans R6-15]